MQTVFNLSEQDFKGSADLFGKYEAAMKNRNEDELRILSQKEWEFSEEARKARTMGDSKKGMEFQNLRDSARGKKINLETQRVRQIEQTRNEFRKFIQPYRKAMLRKISDAWVPLEKIKTVKILEGNAHHSLYGRMIRFESNLIAVLSAQEKLAQEHEELTELMAPLKEMADRVDTLLAGIPVTFGMQKFLLTEIEFLNFKTLLRTATELDRDDYVPFIVPASHIKRIILDLQTWTKR
jgi:hypothetical protein